MSSEMILVKLTPPRRGAPENALLPAHIAWAMLAAGEAADPRDRFGNAVPAEAPAPAPEPAPKAAYKTRAMRAKR